MRYDFTPEQQAWRDEVRAFLRDNITPELLDEQREAGNEGKGPRAQQFILKMRDRGLFGIAWAKEYGGLGRSAIDQWIFVDELEGAGAPMLPLGITSVAPTIQRVGSEAQKQYWLPRITSAEIDFAVAYSESEAGTDMASLRTRAVLDGDEWVINGQKMWNTMAHMATHNWVALRTEPEAPKHKGISMMIVPMDAPGVTVQGIYVWPGLRTNALFFDNVRVPRDHLIGERGMGFYYAAMALNFERLAIGSVGMVRRYFRELVRIVRELQVDGEPVAKRPWVRERLARLALDIVGIESQILTGGEEDSWPGVMRQRGRDGYAVNPMQASFFFSRSETIWGGTAEIQRNIVGERVLGLPREPKVEER